MAAATAPDPVTLPPGVAVRVAHISKTFKVGVRFDGVQSVWGRRRRGEEIADDDDEDEEDLLSVDAEPSDAREDPQPPSDSPRRMDALRDVSFVGATGTAIGIIGEAGAGKTTLLRILGRAIPPTSGRIVIAEPVAPPFIAVVPALQGRMTGEQSLTHMANLLGLPRPLLTEAADEIFAFAGLEAHRSLEVHRWPRGFTQNLVMSAMLHISPRVLLSDGAPVAGDPEFRRRCFERVTELKRAGMTVVMTCKDTKTLRRHADYALWLEAGTVRARGPMTTIADAFDAAQGDLGLDAVRRARRAERQAAKVARAATGAERKADLQRRAAQGLRRTPGEDGDHAQPIEVLDIALLDDDGAELHTVSPPGLLWLRIRFSVAVTGLGQGRVAIVGGGGPPQKLGQFAFAASIPTVLEARARVDTTSLPVGEVTARLRLEFDSGSPLRSEVSFAVLGTLGDEPATPVARPRWEVRPAV